MENASKALIIAGAILLSILIIALGVYVYNMAANAINTDQLDALEISTFNAQFTQYEGKQLGSNVKTLISAIISSNNTYSDAAERLVSVQYYAENATTYETSYEYDDVDTSNVTQASTDLGTLRSSLSTKHYYNVILEYDDEGLGLITTCIIEYTSGQSTSSSSTTSSSTSP